MLLKRLSSFLQYPKYNFSQFLSSLPSKMKALIPDKPGKTSTFPFHLLEVSTPIPKENESLVKIKAFGLNRADILQFQGKYLPPKGTTPILGLEFSGYLVENGIVNQNKKVMGITVGGAYGEYVSVHKDHLISLPEGLEIVQAAAIPEAWIMAYKLCKMTKISHGDYVLIHAAASGVGTAIIQLLRHYKAYSICLASTNEKIKRCLELGGDYAYALLRKESNLVKRISEITSNRLCDVIFDCVGASEFDRNMELASIDCRWVCYGFLGGSIIQRLNLVKLMNKRVNLNFTTLRNRSDAYKSQLISEFTREIIPKFQSHEFSPVIDRIYNGVENISIALQRMERNENIGKIIIKWN